MAESTYDIIAIGGGIAGSALAKAMAEGGAKVLVLEREVEFRDRVRGEAIMPWGTAEAVRLGIYDALIASGGHSLRYWDNHQSPDRTSRRDLNDTTTPKTSVTTFYHPEAQDCLIAAAQEAGAEVRRGARVTGIEMGDGPAVSPAVFTEQGGRQEVIQSRLVVGADGSDSMVRQWAGFETQRDPGRNLIAGVLFDGISASDEASHVWLNPDLGQWILLFPQGKGRARAYVCYPDIAGFRLTGQKDIPRFIEEAEKGGVRPENFAGAIPAGPLATFDGAAAWVKHPYQNGVALIGGAAAAPDPTWGQGMSMSLRDSRVLRDKLLGSQDWDKAGHAYADEHDQYYGVIHALELWQTDLLLAMGPEADARRKKAFAAWRGDPHERRDELMSGPEGSLGEKERAQFFGET